MTREPRPGKTIASRYQILHSLGVGGFGQVWLARDEELHVEVALKQIRMPGSALDVEQLQRVTRALREAQYAARLRDHPHVVTVHDVLEHEGEPWIVMQFVDGHSLAEMLRRDGRLPIGTVKRIAKAILSALRSAHESGIIHRDVKPANVLLTDDGRVLLTDFGIAVAVTETRLTDSNVIVGSPGYVAPERLQGGESSAAVDLFALGVTLYEASEGAPPFDRQNPTAPLTEEPRPPEHSGELGPLLLKMMGKIPSQRPDAREALCLLAATARDLNSSQGATVVTAIDGTKHLSGHPNPAESLAITSGRLETIRARGAARADSYGMTFGAFCTVIALALGLHGLPEYPNASLVEYAFYGLLVGSVGGYFLGWIIGGWSGLFGDLDSLAVNSAGLVVVEELMTVRYAWSDLNSLKLQQSGNTATLIAAIEPDRISDTAWRLKHPAKVSKSGTAKIFIGRGIPAIDIQRMSDRLKHLG